MNQEHSATLDATLAAAGSKATTAGATTTVVSWFLSSEFGFLVGVVVAVGGFLINWYYRHKQDQREQAEHDRRMGK